MILKPDRPVLSIVTGHWLSLIGACLVTSAAICWLLALPAQIRGHVSNPYIGILLFVILPLIFIGGLVLVPLGVYLARQRVLDRATSLRRLAVFLGVTTFFNLLIGSQLTYRAVEHMETVQFCGQSCHVMKPEFTAYQNAVHSRVLCVDCHVAPGASGWFESKLAGTRQLLAVALNNYPRPIESAMESNRLVPSSQTCENCHWPQSATPPRLRVIPDYKEDEQNTPSHTVLLMRPGIHGAHFGSGIRIQYAAADAKRQIIPWVEYRNQQAGTVRTYVASDAKAEDLPKHEMQCVDCHNRPAHVFELPERAINRAISAGEIPLALPFIKKKSLELLKADYGSAEEAAQKIGEGLRKQYPQIERTVQTVSSIYARNVFPDLKVTWGTYPDNMGHTDSPGCFRCHDDSHATAEKKTIAQDCTSCHEMLAVEEASPEILKTLNLGDRIGEIQRR